MTETLQSTPSVLADQASQLAAAHGLMHGALGGVLLALVERLEAPFGIKEMPSGRYVHASLRMAALLGRSPDHVIGHTDAELLGPDAAAALRAADQSAMAAPPVPRITAWRKSPPGTCAFRPSTKPKPSLL